MTARVASVNVGRPRPVDTGRRVVETAIWTRPVAGRVAVRGVNVDGDDQADRTVHGGPGLADAARRLGVSATTVKLAWLLPRSPVVLPIPGPLSLEHLRENLAALDLDLGDAADIAA